MKEVTYKCNHCEKKWYNDDDVITIGIESNDDDSRIFYKNPHPEMNQIKELNRYSDMHFCSQVCFVRFFLDTENERGVEKLFLKTGLTDEPSKSDELRPLFKHDVMGRSELLKAFFHYVDMNWANGMLTDQVDEVIDGFEKSL